VVSDENTYAIETIGLTKIFPDWWGRAKVVAVEDLNLQIRYNEIYGFLGPNGSGKTTTLKMILNLLHPTRGKAFVLGGSCDNPEISTRIGYLPEESYLYRYLTARETLDFYGRIFGLPREVRNERIETLLEMVGLAGMGNRPVGTFSKGMARRIGLAQALINDPDVLILDEPTSGMDPMGTRQMKDLLAELARRGKTILLCSHLLADVEDICDRIGILYGGRMRVEGPVRELLQHQDQTEIHTGRLSEAALEQIQDILRREGHDCDVRRPMDKLETYFINIVNKALQEKQATSGAGVGTGITGFLAERPVVRSQSLLDQLVSARVGPDEQPSASTAATEKTKPESKPEPKPEPQADKSLLSRLTAAKPDAEPETDKTDAAPPTPPEAVEKVKKDVLESLIERKGKSDGSTEVTRPQDSGDERNA